MKNIIKKTLKLSVLLLLLLVFSLLFIWHTQSGTRWALGFVTKRWLPELSYASVSGTFSSDLSFTSLKYQDQGIDITADQIKLLGLSYQWLAPQLSLKALENNRLSIAVKESPTDAKQPTLDNRWEGFALPLALDLEQISINTLVWQTGDEPIEVNDIHTRLLAKDDHWQVRDLSFHVFDTGCQLSLDAVTNPQLPMEIGATCQWAQDGRQVISQWGVKGDLKQLRLDAEHQINGPEVKGTLTSNGSVSNLLIKPDWQLILASNRMDVFHQSQQYELTDWTLAATGQGDQFKLNNDVNLTLNGQQPANWKWQGEGDFNHLNLKQMTLAGAPGLISGEANLQWFPNWQVGAVLAMNALDTSWLHPAWPGQVDANITVQAQEGSADHWFVDVPSFKIKGQLKQAPIDLEATARWPLSGAIEGQGVFDWGSNTGSFTLNHGGVGNGDWTLDATLDWQQLKLLNQDLTGTLKGLVKANNKRNQLDLSGQLELGDLKWQETALSRSQLRFSGDPNGALSMDVEVEGLAIQGQMIDQGKITVNGTVDAHQVTVQMEGPEWHNDMAFDGRYMEQQGYQVQLKQHQMKLKTINKQWQLEQPTAIGWSSKGLAWSKSCWQPADGVGQLCLEWGHDGKQQSQGQINLSQFDLEPWQFLMPQGFKLDGEMNGGVTVQWQSDDVNIDGEMSVEKGHWITQPFNVNQEKVAFTHFTVTGRQVNDDSQFDIKLALEDGSYLNLNAHLHPDEQLGLTVSGGYQAHIGNNAMIAELFDEIKSMEGQLHIEGRIQGPITEPQLAAKVELLEGALSLQSVDVPLQHVVVIINSHKDKTYLFKAAAQAGEGQVESEGTVFIDWGESLDWQIDSSLKGDAFQVANSSELTLSVTPNLKIMAKPEQTTVQGDLLVNQGHIKINKVANGIATLPDEVVIKDQVVATSVHAILVDVQTNIEDDLPLEILGLKAKLSGALHLSNSASDPSIKATGTLYLKDGVYQIYGQSLQLSQGLLLFDGDLANPSLQIRAERVINSDQTVGVKIEGPVEDFKTTLYATPALNEAETLSYLVTGYGLEGLTGDEQSEAMAEAVLMMGLQHNSELMENLKSSLGIDVFNVSNQGDMGATLEAGKNFGKKLFVGYNQGLFKHIGYWLIRYRINDKLHLETRQGEEQSVDLVYRREKK